MEIMEIGVGRLSASTNGGAFEPEPNLRYLLPDLALETLADILAPYDQSAHFYLDHFVASFIPWLTVCMDREYSLAAHVFTTRPSRSEIGFGPYARRMQEDETPPKVGAIFIRSKQALIDASDRSPLFGSILAAMADQDACKNWILFPGPLNEPWVAKAEKLDEGLWKKREGATVA